ncbi:MAG: NAD-dependent epimerase/dehydratase family protein [Sulfuritalea sp.]|nr:NAD-dependent epimerase/dehydratase family protein [Sulfuritalea sp.]
MALALAARGHKVRVLDNLAEQIHGADPESSTLFQSIRGRVDFMRGSVTSETDLLEALRGVDTVVHFAAETGTGQSMYAIHHYSEVNVGGTVLLLDLIANKPFPVKKIIVASSRAIYGEGKYFCHEHGFVYPSSRLASNMEKGDFSVRCPKCADTVDLIASDESTPVSPSSVYGITKLTQEQMVLTVGKALGISAIALRYQNVYGPGQSLSNPYTGILSIFSTRLLNGSGINIFEDGKESRDFVFIDDAVAATVLALDFEKPLIEAFNVGSGKATDVVTVAETMQRLLGTSVPIEITGQFRTGDIRHNVAHLTKIKHMLGFEPLVSIDEGIREFVRWVKAETVQTDKYDQSLSELREKGLLWSPLP